MPRVRRAPGPVRRSIEAGLPLLGVDRSGPPGRQPPGTCPTAINIVDHPPYNSVAVLGKRAGFRRAFTDRCVEATGESPRIIGMDTLYREVNPTDAVAPTITLKPDGTVSFDANFSFGGSGGPVSFHNALNFSVDEPDDEVSMVIVGCIETADTNLVVSLNNNAPATPVSVSIRFRVRMFQDAQVPPGNAGDDRGTGSTADFDGAAAHTDLPGGGLKLDLLETGTLRATTGEVLPTALLDWQDFSYTLSSVELASIGNYDNLRLRIVATAGSRGFEITDAAVTIVQGTGTQEGVQNKILALQVDKAWVGDLAADTLVATTNTPGPGTDLIKSSPEIESYNLKWYVVDGDVERVINPTGPTCDPWTGGASGIPQNCQLLRVYRERMFQARPVGNLSLWYASRIGDPHDYEADDDEEVIERSAVTGNNRFVGQPGDAITALMNVWDDYLVMGCAASLYKMEGDPGYGGRVDILFDGVGVLGPRAFCIDEKGNLWFFGTGDIYMLPRGGTTPVPVTGGRLYNFIESVDLTTTLVQMAYDATRSHVWVFFTNLNDIAAGQDTTRHVLINVRTGALWLVRIADNEILLRPWSTTRLTGAKQFDRRFLYGDGRGWIMRPDDRALGDDWTRSGTSGGRKINCVADLGPFVVDEGEHEWMLTEIRADGPGPGSNLLNLPLGPLGYKVMAAGTADEVLFLTAVASNVQAQGQFFASSSFGQERVGATVTGGAHRIRLEHNTSDSAFAIHRLRLEFERMGPRR